MKWSVDTNVLIRAVVQDDPAQARKASKLLTQAELIAVALPCLCEFVWVLLKVYKFKNTDASAAIRALIATANVQVNRPAVEAGLALLDAGVLSRAAEGGVVFPFEAVKDEVMVEAA